MVNKDSMINTHKHNPPGTARFRELDSENPPPPEKMKVSTQISIQKARQANKMTQRELAIKLNMQTSIINDYESGKAIPNRQILIKLGQILCVKLI
jgi:putative transcription factor